MRARRRRSTPYSPLSCSSCPPTSVRLSPSFSRYAARGAAAGRGKGERWTRNRRRRHGRPMPRGDRAEGQRPLPRTDGRAVAVVHYALALPRRMARYLSALAAHPLARSLSLPLHLLPMAREEQSKKTVMHAMPRNQSATATARRRFEWTPPSRRNRFPPRL